MAKPAALQGVDPFEQPTRRTKAPATAGELQAAVEGVTVDNRVEFMGDSYRIADKVGLMPLMRFAHAAQQGTNADDIEGLAAIYDMLHDCIHEADWERFEHDATVKKADGDDLLPVVSQTIELLAARPTQRPSDSSDGPLSTSVSSTESSPSPDTSTGVVRERLIRVQDLAGA